MISYYAKSGRLKRAFTLISEILSGFINVSVRESAPKLHQTAYFESAVDNVERRPFER